MVDDRSMRTKSYYNSEYPPRLGCCPCFFACFGETNNFFFELREAIEKMEQEERDRVSERQARVDSVMAVSRTINSSARCKVQGPARCNVRSFVFQYCQVQVRQECELSYYSSRASPGLYRMYYISDRRSRLGSVRIRTL